jgi:hypothetical protein
MVALVIAFPQLVGHDKAVEAGGAEIDIQQMLQQDADKTSESAAPPSTTQDDDAITKAIRDASKSAQ